MKQSLILFVFIFWSCASDKKAIRNFEACLDKDELASYSKLEKLCDKFISVNYPRIPLDKGYEAFLDDLMLSDTSKYWTMDTLHILEMNNLLKDTFKETYDFKESNFLPNSSVMTCLMKFSNSRFVDKFAKDKSRAGYIGPHIISGEMSVRDESPTAGLNKILFVTDVVWRCQYYTVTTK